MNLFSDFGNLSNFLNTMNISSYEQIKNFKNNNQLDQIIEQQVDLEKFKNNLTNYLNFLFNNNYLYYKKRLILEKDYITTFQGNSEYILSLYCDKEDAYRNFPLLIKSLTEKLYLYPYYFYSYEDYISKIFELYNMKSNVNLNTKKINNTINYASKINQNKYNLYFEKNNSNSINLNNKTDFYIYAEHWSYYQESLELSKIGYNDVIWAAKDCGDGLGYDILSYNPLTNKEKLIEVKSGHSSLYTLSENEFDTMKKCFLKNAEYYIHRYFYNNKTNDIEYTELEFLANFNVLIDKNKNLYELQDDTLDVKKLVYKIVKK